MTAPDFLPVLARSLPDRVLEILRERGPSTAAEIADFLDMPDGRSVTGALKVLYRRRQAEWYGERKGRTLWREWTR